tara:strand:+ start:59 stop:364 length:306 start_codon:yes stop_codon:yes gene_type:complete
VQFDDDLSRKYRVRRRVFSYLSFVVVVAGFGGLVFLNPDKLEFGNQEAGIVLFVLLTIFLLKRRFWKCPACNRGLDMGGIHVSDLRRSNVVRCPHCGVILK